MPDDSENNKERWSTGPGEIRPLGKFVGIDDRLSERQKVNNIKHQEALAEARRSAPEK